MRRFASWFMRSSIVTMHIRGNGTWCRYTVWQDMLCFCYEILYKLTILTHFIKVPIFSHLLQYHSNVSLFFCHSHTCLVLMCARNHRLLRVFCNYSSERGAVSCMADGPAPCCIRYPWQPPPSSQLTALSWLFTVTKCHYSLCRSRQSRSDGRRWANRLKWRW